MASGDFFSFLKDWRQGQEAPEVLEQVHQAVMAAQCLWWQRC